MSSESGLPQSGRHDAALQEPGFPSQRTRLTIPDDSGIIAHMEIGIIGLPQSGKTTLFHALAGAEKATAAYSAGRLEIHTATTNVPDERVDILSKMFNPRKTIYAKVTYADIAGLDKGITKKGLPGPFVNQLGQMDAFVHVLRAFPDPMGAAPIDPAGDLAILDTEFLLNDLGAVERRYEKILESTSKGAKDKDVAVKEKALFEKLKAWLEQEKPLRDLDLTPDEMALTRGYGFLSLKPMLIVINCADEGTPPDVAYGHQHSAVVPLRGRLEREIAELSPEDAPMFMEEYGITELSRSKVIRLSYDLLGVQSFFTVGEDEVRAWTILRGATAVDAAGAIHTDLAKGFIRAEVTAYKDLIELGGLKEAHHKGKQRLEGKEYIVHDGDIVHIRHSG
jgi:GTP-binding protein YchF